MSTPDTIKTWIALYRTEGPFYPVIIGDRQLEVSSALFFLADRLSLKHARVSFDELLGMWKAHGYRPTLRADLDPELGMLADLYDFTADERGLGVKAYRG